MNKEELEEKYRKAARAKYHTDGEIEVDEKAAVSMSDDANADGCYVQTWVWVAADAVEVSHDA